MTHDSSRQLEHYAALHERVLRADKIAAEAIVVELLPWLERSLHRLFRTASRDDTFDAAVDALIDYIGRPHQFDAARGLSLHVYLRLAAVRNLQDTRRRELRRLVREQQYAEECARRSAELPEVAPPASFRPFSFLCALRPSCPRL